MMMETHGPADQQFIMGHMREAGFTVKAPAANPPVKDRVNAMNAMFCNAQGERHYLVNEILCPTYADSLEQQAWAMNGEPDKTTGHDHPNDGAGYFISFEFPLVRPTLSRPRIVAG